MKVTVFDYGAGNLHSLLKALEGEGRRVAVETDPSLALRTDVLIFPGVGAFGHAAARLAPNLGEVRAAIADGLPCLGICLGMQLLFDGSDESPGIGLSVIHGRVRKLAGDRVPQIGWNDIENDCEPLLRAAPLPIAYYANSYVCNPDDLTRVYAWSEHAGKRFPAIVRMSRTVGVQFHPEKSSHAGVAFVHAFLREVST